MSIYLGSNAVPAVYIGSTPAVKVYLGSTEIWSAAVNQDITGSLAVTATLSGTGKYGQSIAGTTLAETATLSGTARYNTHQDITGSLAVTATLSGTARNHDRLTIWTSKSDTASPSTTEDTGQTGVSYSSSAFPFRITSGRLTMADNNVEIYDYRYWDDTDTVTRIGGRFSFRQPGGRSTGYGGVTMLIMNDSMANQSLTSFRIACHLTVTPFGWVLSKATNATGTLTFTQLDTAAFGTALAFDHVTIHYVNVRRSGTTWYMTMPDGSTPSATDADAANWSGPHGCHEINAIATDVIPEWAETWADTYG